MIIELTCRICGRPHLPSSDEIRKGPDIYRRCPACRLVEGPAHEEIKEGQNGRSRY